MNPLYTSETNIFDKNNFGSALYMQTSKFFLLKRGLISTSVIIGTFIISFLSVVILDKVAPFTLLKTTWFKLFKIWILMLPIIAAIADAHLTIKVLNTLRHYDEKENRLMGDGSGEPMSLLSANIVFSQYLYCTGMMVMPFVSICMISFIFTHDIEISGWMRVLFYIILDLTYAMYFKIVVLPKEEDVLKNAFITILRNEGLKYDELIDCSAIVARNAKNYIGKNGKLMYKLRKDMSNFKTLTTCYGHGIVIMGRKTWESIGCKPLPHRTNIVVTTNKKVTCKDSELKPIVAGSIEEALAIAYTINFTDRHMIADNIWIIGGSSIYNAAMRFTRNIYVTLVCDETEGDTTMVFPKYDFLPAFMSESIQDGDYVTYQQIFVRRKNGEHVDGDINETTNS